MMSPQFRTLVLAVGLAGGLLGCGGNKGQAHTDPGDDNPPGQEAGTPELRKDSAMPPADGADASAATGKDAAPATDSVATPGDQADAPAATHDAGPGHDSASNNQDAPSVPVTGGDPIPCKADLCESFETFADGAKPTSAAWTISGYGNPTFAVDGARAARGKKSLHIHTTNMGTEAYLKETKTFPAMGNAFYGRLYFWIDAIPPADYEHWNLIEARGPDNKFVVREGGQSNSPKGSGASQFLFNVEPHNTLVPEKAKADNRNIPTKTWNCVEWFFDADKNVARLWWNGEERTRLTYMNEYPAAYAFPKFTALYLGWGFYQNQQAGFSWDVWLDEIAVGSTRIGCE